MSSRDWAYLVWAVLGAAAVLWLGATWASGGRLPTLDAVVVRVRASRVGRLLLALGWMWLGWHVFAR